MQGLVMVGGGVALYTRLSVHSSYLVDLLPGMLLVGVGAGLVFPSLATLAMSSPTADDSGLASGLLNTTAQVGGALGLAVLATLAASQTQSLLASGESTQNALTGGFQMVFGMSAALIVAGFVLAMIVLREERPSTIEVEDAA